MFRTNARRWALKWLVLATLLLSPAAYAVPQQAYTVASIAALQALGSSSSSYPLVYVQDYGAGAGGGGEFAWNASSTAATDGGTVFQATGVTTGRWIRQLDRKIVTPQMFGAVCNRSTDDAVPIQNAENAASANGYALIFIGPTYCEISAAITPKPGVDHYCDTGMNNTKSTGGASSNIPCGIEQETANAWVYDMPTTSFTGSNVQAPTFHDMTIAGVGGGIRIGNPSAGTTGQGAALYFKVDRVNFNLQHANHYSIQASVCFYCQITNSAFFLPIYIWGGDLVNVSHNSFEPNYANDTQTVLSLIGSGTYGNEDIADHNYIGCPNGGTICVQINAQSAELSYNEIECLGTGLTSTIDIAAPNGQGGLSTDIVGNNVSCMGSQATHWLSVENTQYIYKMVVTNNWIGGNGYFGNAIFNSGNGMPVRVPGGSFRSQIIHNGNSTENGFPWSSANNEPENGTLAAGSLMYWWPGGTSYNVDSSNYGANVYANNGAYLQPASSGGNELDFDQAQNAMTGSLDVCAKLWSSTPGQQENLISMDGGTAINTRTVTLTANPTWYCYKFGSYATGANVRLTNTDTTHGGVVNISAVAINQVY
jgi:hypothetical protein